MTTPKPWDHLEDPEWQRGYWFGLDDNHLQWWEERYYSESFIRGYSEGKAEIDRLVEEAVEARNMDGEWR